ncbi:MAG: ABC transporter permease [Lachnospiraceae bacterium]|nr:ABC transporter permease [Lachnospiraceae bacterium]
MSGFNLKEGKTKLISSILTLLFAVLMTFIISDDVIATGIGKKIPFGNDIPVMGIINGENGKDLYVIDITEYTPNEGVFDYMVVTGDYLGTDYTFLTDKSRNVKIIYCLDENKSPYLYAYNEEYKNLYPVGVFNFGNGEVYITSLKACLSLPDDISEDEIGSNTIFYSIDKNGNGGVYRYSADGQLLSWGEMPVNVNEKTADSVPIIGIVAAFAAAVVVIVLLVLLVRNLVKAANSNKHKTGKKRIKQIAAKDSRPESRIGRIRQYIFVIRELTDREIKRKYVGSKLGVIWSILNPLLMMIVMSLIFSFMFKRSIENFPLYYLGGSLMYSLFSEITTNTMSALVDNKGLLIRTKLPFQVFILSRAYTALVNYAYSLIPFVFILLVFRVKPSISMIMIIPVTILTMLMSIGISYMLSTAYVFFEDVKYLYNGVFMRILMYLSALFYPVDRLPQMLKKIIGFNPLYVAIYITRESVIYGRAPYYTAWIKLALATVICFFGGLAIFNHNKNKIMQRI